MSTFNEGTHYHYHYYNAETPQHKPDEIKELKTQLFSLSQKMDKMIEMLHIHAQSQLEIVPPLEFEPGKDMWVISEDEETLDESISDEFSDEQSIPGVHTPDEDALHEGLDEISRERSEIKKKGGSFTDLDKRKAVIDKKLYSLPEYSNDIFDDIVD